MFGQRAPDLSLRSQRRIWHIRVSQERSLIWAEAAIPVIAGLLRNSGLSSANPPILHFAIALQRLRRVIVHAVQ